MAKSKITISWIDKKVEELSYIVDVDEKSYIHLRKQITSYLKVNIYISNDKEIPLNYLPERMKTYVYKRSVCKGLQ